MTSSDDLRRRIPARREPPRFRRVRVRHVEDRSPRLRRVVLGGEDLAGLTVEEPAASVRLLLPPGPGEELVIPEWSGNEFRLPDGERAPIRTFTPRSLDTDALELTLEIVMHEGGAASDWAVAARVDDEVAVSGPGRGYEIDREATAYLLAGDETAIPAISQLLEALPAGLRVDVLVEVADPAAEIELPAHPRASVEWLELARGAAPGAALVDAVTSMPDIPRAVWVAGEAAAVQKIRRHLFDQRGLSREEATVRGYWKHGRSAT